MTNGLIALLPNLILALLFLFIAVMLGRGVREIVRRLATQYAKENSSVGVLLGHLAQGLIVVIGVLIALSIAIPSFKPAQVIQLLGISSVAIGFAFKDIFQNFLGGILILITQPFRIGDQIVAGGFEGTVEDIQTRATMIRTYDGRRVVIPNANLFTGSVEVNTAFTSRRTEYNCGIGYADDIDEAKATILQVMCDTEGVLDDPKPDVLVVSVGDSAVILRARWWSLPTRGEVLVVQDRVISRIQKTLIASGIDTPYPTYQLLFHDQTEETDGDRARQREGWPVPKNDAAPRPRFLMQPRPDRHDVADR